MINYSVQYYHEYHDISGVYHKVELLALEYSGGATEIIYSGEKPVIIRHGGSDKNSFENVIIQGQELQFNFYIPNDDVATIDPLFSSDYKDYKLKYYVGGTTDSYLEFVGWVNPENLSKEFSTNPPYVEINLSANDGLTSLKDIEFRNANDQIINDRITILEVLKYALAKTGIELDFMIQLGTYESAAMASTDCALKKTYVDARRFADEIKEWMPSSNFNRHTIMYQGFGSFYVGSGTIMSCWAVIESVLLDFNVTIKQHKNRYWIQSKNEISSYVFNFDYATLTQQSRTAFNSVVDISNYQFKLGIEQQKIIPLKKVQTTFKNKDLGGDLPTVDLNNWTEGVVWTSNAPLTNKPDLGRGWMYEFPTIPLVATNEYYIELVDKFVVDKVTESDYIKVVMGGAFIAAIATVFAPVDTVLVVEVQRPDFTWHTGPIISHLAFNPSRRPTTSEVTYQESYYESPLTDAFKVTETGEYKIRFIFKSYYGTNWNYFFGQIGGVHITKVVGAAYNIDTLEASSTTDSELTTFDRLYEQTISKNQHIFEATTLFADCVQISEIGSLCYKTGATFYNTDRWNSYGHTEAIKILDLYSRAILNNRFSYKNYLRFIVIDRSNTIGFNNTILINGDYYSIASISHDFKMGELTMELIEILTTGQTYNEIYEKISDSVNGESVSFNNVPAAVGVSHNGLNGIEGGYNSHYYHISEDLYNGLNDTSAFYVNPTTHRVGIGTLSPNAKLDVQIASGGISAMFGGLASEGSNGGIYFTGVNQINAGYYANSNFEFAINYHGYNAETTQFRDFNVYDGKQNSILFVDGSTGNVGIGATSPNAKLNVFAGNPNLSPSLTHHNPSSAITIENAGVEIAQGSYDGSPYAWWIQIRAIDTHWPLVLNPLGGNIGIGNTAPNYTLEVTGTGYFSSNLFTGANVGTTSFASGFAGSGWQLGYAGADSTLTVDNLIVRKALTAYELDINKISSVNGGIIVSAANGTAISLFDSGEGWYNVFMDEDGGNKPIQFQVYDFVRAQIWTGRGIASFVGQVIEVTHSTTYGAAHIQVVTYSGTPWVGMELVQIGNSDDVDRQNLIYITASDTNSPYIDMLTGVDSSGGSFVGKQALRIGNLTGITDAAFGGALSGYGLWANNVYLSGGIYATFGAIGGWGITEDYLATTTAGLAPADYPFYAGVAYADRADANFRVDSSGICTLTGATIATDTSGKRIVIDGTENNMVFYASALNSNRIIIDVDSIYGLPAIAVSADSIQCGGLLSGNSIRVINSAGLDDARIFDVTVTADNTIITATKIPEYDIYLPTGTIMQDPTTHALYVHP